MFNSTECQIPIERVRHTLYALAFASMVCIGMLLVRFGYVWDLRFRFSGLLGNLLLAWIPLILALLIRRIARGDSRFWLRSASIAWVLFFPNAFYIATDLIHTKKFGTDGVYRWFDMLMTTSFACAGAFLGTFSLYLMQLFVRQKFGSRCGWLFAGAMLALGAFGIYLGRFLRLNSWDVIARPFKLLGDIAGLLDPKRMPEVAAFSVTFFFFSLAVYSFLVSMARLHASPSPSQQGNETSRSD